MSKNVKQAAGSRKGHNKAPKGSKLPTTTTADAGRALRAELEQKGKANNATAVRFRTFLLACLSNSATLASIKAHWSNAHPEAGRTADTRDRIDTAKETLYSMFGAPAKPDDAKTEAGDAKKKRQAGERLVIESLDLVVAIDAGNHNDAFEFTNEGGTYVKYASPLGKRIWAEYEWDKNDTYNQRREADKDIQLVSSPWYSEPARAIAWSEFKTLIVGAKRVNQTGRGNQATRDTVTDAKPSQSLQTVANYFESNAPKANDMGAVRVAMENVARIVKLTLANVAPAAKHLATFDAWFKDLQATIGKAGKVDVVVTPPATNVVTLTTPAEVAKLPEGKPTRAAKA